MRVALLLLVAAIGVLPGKLGGRITRSLEAQQSVRVWVNTSSNVYHCAGTRWYGKTARGGYLDEATARAQGNRPANGRTCGIVAASPPKSSPPATPPTTSQPRAALNAPTGPAAIRVWVNTVSSVYHCPGTRWYGKTNAGRYTTQAEAKARGARPANGREC